MASVPLTPTHRRAEWWRVQLVPALAGLALATDFVYGLVLMLAPEAEFDSAVYRAAFKLMDVNGWGALLLALTGAAALTWWVQGRCRLGAFWLAYGLGTGYWMFWTILAVWSTLGLNGVSGAHAVLSGALGGAHVLAGLAWPMVRHDHLRSRRA